MVSFIVSHNKNPFIQKVSFFYLGNVYNKISHHILVIVLISTHIALFFVTILTKMEGKSRYETKLRLMYIQMHNISIFIFLRDWLISLPNCV